MAFIVANTGEQMKAKQFGGMMNTFAQNKDYIIKDIGEEFECLFQEGSLDIQVGTGQAIIGGRSITAEESNTLSLQANSTIYLCLRIDLSQVEGQVGMLYANTSSEIEQGNLNDDSSAIRDLLLAIITTDSNGITDVEDKRTIQATAGVSSYVGKVEINNLQTESEMKAIFGEDTSWQLLAGELPIGHNVFGNGIGLGLTDGSVIGSMGTNNQAEHNIAFVSQFGKELGTRSTLTQHNGVTGLITKAQLDNGEYPYSYTGLEMQSITINLWLRIA